MNYTNKLLNLSNLKGEKMNNIKLTCTERLILSNQYEILSVIKNDKSYEYIAEQLRDGHSWLYSRIFEGISPELSQEDTDLVLNILEIYSYIKDGYKNIGGTVPEIKDTDIEFPGFDGNNEGQLFWFSRALRNSGYYEELIPENGKNSHTPTKDIYKRMINKWNLLGNPRGAFKKQDILDILGARFTK